MARNFKVGAAALTIALSLNPLGNGASRFLWGWVSDSLGRERTMAVAFFLQAIFLASVVTLGRRGDVWFVVTMALVFLTWGELYVLFPAVLADLFGARHAASNYSFLYSTKGVASILGRRSWPRRCSKRRARGTMRSTAARGWRCARPLVRSALRRMPLPKKPPVRVAESQAA